MRVFTPRGKLLGDTIIKKKKKTGQIIKGVYKSFHKN